MAQYLPQKPAAIHLIAALATNSYFLYGNLGAATIGVVPHALEQSSPYDTVRAINWFIEKGKVNFFASGILSGALFGYTAYLAPQLRVQHLSTVAAASMFAIFPYTAAFMLPTNKALEEMESGGSQALEGKEEKALEKVHVWRGQHVVRIILGAAGWAAGMLALELL